MPNWCSNVLTVSGRAEDLQKEVYDESDDSSSAGC